MDLDLKDKLALVTGSTRGISLATAKDLVDMGADVTVSGAQMAHGPKPGVPSRQSQPNK